MELRIKEAAKALGVSPDTLRYYEKLGLLRPKRTGSGYRLYSPELLERVRFIQKAQALGLSLEEIREILEVAQDHPPCAHVRRLLQEKLKKVEEQIARLEALKIALSERLAYAEANPDPAATVRTTASIWTPPDTCKPFRGA